MIQAALLGARRHACRSTRRLHLDTYSGLAGCARTIW